MSWDNTGAEASNWDNTGAEVFNWDTTNGGAGGFTADAGGFTADGNGFTGDGAFSGGDGGDDGDRGAGGVDTCRNCQQTGHFSRDCPEPRQNTGECYNCGQSGHNKADCTNERVERPFTGTCRHCEKEGHRAAECPDKPADICRLCGQEGHKAITCEELRTDMFRDATEMSADEAWTKMKEADAAKDLDDFKDAFFAYAKAVFIKHAQGEGDAIDLADIQQGFRSEDMNMHFIAKEEETSDVFTLISPAGVINQKYKLSFNWGPEPKRKFFAAGWPGTPEENLERLNEGAGIPFDSGIPKCGNCGVLGHIKKHCKEEPAEVIEGPKIQCVICNETGHRARDCIQERVDHFACRNCKKSGHTSKECLEPRSAEGVECKTCNEVGHFSRDCPTRGGPMTCRNCGEAGHKALECDKPRVMKCRNCEQNGHSAKECTEPKNMANMQCRNCDEMGHASRDCPKPRDYSKVQCRNCGEMGHGAARCKNAAAAPPAMDDAGAGGNFGGTVDFGGADAVPVEAAAGGWGSAAIEASGGW